MQMTMGQSLLNGFDSTIIGITPLKGCCVSKGALSSDLLRAPRNCMLVQHMFPQLDLFRQFTAVSACEAHASLDDCSSLGTCSSSGVWPLPITFSIRLSYVFTIQFQMVNLGTGNSTVECFAGLRTWTLIF